MLKKMRKKAGALLVMICLGVIILLCWEAGEHLKDKILRSLETAAEARTGKQTVVLDSGHGGSDSGKVGINGAKEKEINLLIAKEIRRLLEKEKIEVIMVREKDEELGKSKVEDLKYRVSLMNEKKPSLAVSIHQNSYQLIRKAFIPKEGYIFVDADYSQVELRVLAHLSGDEVMKNAFLNNVDIHATTASEVFEVPIDEVTSLQRRHAKAVNFGIVYGISAFGLSEDLGISRKEASDFIAKYYDTYKSIKAYLDEQVAHAKEKGYVTTMFGRIRPIPELKSSNFMQRSFGERVAMNSPIQGTAADIIKIAMVRVNMKLKELGLKSQLILQIHDELLIEAAEDEVDIVKKLLVDEMMHAADMTVPLEVGVASGNNWYEAK